MFGLGTAMLICLGIFVIVGFMVFQARFAARSWRREIAAGNTDVLAQLLDDTFEAWRRERPRRGTPPADWRALHTAALVAADPQRIRVSLLAEPDVQVVEGRRVDVSTAQDVARRAAVRMVERVMYEVPHASFEAAQVDVMTEFRRPDGPVESRCLLTTRVTREDAKYADWEDGDAAALLAQWDTREADGADYPDPDAGAIIQPGAAQAEAGAAQAVEDALQARDVRKDERA